MKYSIIIPYHSNNNLLQICLESILSTTPTDVEILIIANNPDTTTLNVFLPSDRCRIYKYQEELYYPKAMNIGVDLANGDYIIFCDADTYYTKGWFENLTSFFFSNSKIGLCSSKLITPLDRSIIDFGIGITQFNCPHPFRGQPLDHPLVTPNIEVQAACTANAIMSKSLFQKLGGFNELLVHSYSDIDLCQRLREQGYSIWCVSNSIVFHKGSSTLGGSMSLEMKGDTKGIWGQLCASKLVVDMDQYLYKSINYLKIQNYSFQTGYYYIDYSTIADKDWYKQIIFHGIDSQCLELYRRPFPQRDAHHISLYEFVDINIRKLSCPLLFFVDDFTALKNNSLWNDLREFSRDLVIDRNANVVPYSTIAFTQYKVN